jgi:hypothetical protein
VPLFAVATLACGSPAAPSSPALTETIESAHFSFHYASGDRVDSTWQEQFHEWAVRQLDVTPARKITYNKYQSRTHMGSLIGVSNTNGFADPSSFTLHTIWPTDNHETVHLYTSLFANPGPVALFNEGMAVAHQVNPATNDFTPKWSGTPLDDITRSARQGGRLPALSTIVETAGFRAIDPNLAYPVSGSFVRYVLDRFGLAPIKEFFRRGTPNDSAETLRTQFLAVFGISFEQAEQDWLAHLG